MDSTLLTILLLLAFATAIALIQARRRDACLKDFDHFHITLAEKDGDLTWGTAEVFTTGLEITYTEPVTAAQGHLERSFIFYKDQYEAMDALYRYPEGLGAEAQERRRAIIERTAKPGLGRRLLRRLQNWISMIRDALMQALSVVIGVAKAQKPGAAVLSSQEGQIKTLSSEIIGHVGNAFDPLLERHLFGQVVVEVTRGGQTFSYCGWLKEYTAKFIEVVDAFALAGDPAPPGAYAPGAESLTGVQIEVRDGRLVVRNGGARLLHVPRVEGQGAQGAWQRPLGCVLPPGAVADLALPEGVEPETVRVWLGPIARFDMVVPRTHALVRHDATASQGPAYAVPSPLAEAAV